MLPSRELPANSEGQRKQLGRMPTATDPGMRKYNAALVYWHTSSYSETNILNQGQDSLILALYFSPIT